MMNCSLWTLSSRVHLYTFASIEEYVLLHHFLAHYRSQGVRLQTNAHIILHAMDAESSNSFMAVARQVASSHGVLDVSEVHFNNLSRLEEHKIGRLNRLLGGVPSDAWPSRSPFRE